jgi:hypothetical protein
MQFMMREVIKITQKIAGKNVNRKIIVNCRLYPFAFKGLRPLYFFKSAFDEGGVGCIWFVMRSGRSAKARATITCVSVHRARQ